MRILSRVFGPNPPTTTNTAAIAKERLQIIVTHERSGQRGPDYLPILKKELLEVVGKYFSIDPSQIKVHLGRNGGCETLELNITLPEEDQRQQPAAPPRNST